MQDWTLSDTTAGILLIHKLLKLKCSTLALRTNLIAENMVNSPLTK